MKRKLEHVFHIAWAQKQALHDTVQVIETVHRIKTTRIRTNLPALKGQTVYTTVPIITRIVVAGRQKSRSIASTQVLCEHGARGSGLCNRGVSSFFNELEG